MLGLNNGVGLPPAHLVHAVFLDAKFPAEPSRRVRLGGVLLHLRPRGVSEVSAQAQQQQDVHGEQVEAEQQRRALARAERHPQHPHQTRAASPGLQETRGEGHDKVTTRSREGHYDDE
ncbi:hypothetical protein EYF80_026638 [Liparis tanakae]|uniref:Uncharacterized protein n=1 Tax=Liparis tanakae TaxID=230148 RepID=A0A4Z2HE48_9TELE|nr:hypothetical protein EYF80_026638 [Liparis tanakae]